tara:strand:- start:15 stop:926 length:912 start_codon:yes stop_codon:yes gene_type:complete
MKLIMESWRSNALNEKREGTQEYSSDYIKQITVGEFMKFVIGDKQISKYTKLMRHFTDTQRIDSKDELDSHDFFTVRFTRAKRVVQIISGLFTRGGIGALIGIIATIDLFATGGTATTVLFTIVALIATQYGAEYLEVLFVKELERKIGFNDEITNYEPKELEMVFGIDDEIIRLMRGGDASAGSPKGNTEMAQEFTRQALERLKNMSEAIFREITPRLKELEGNITPMSVVNMMMLNPERLNKEVEYANKPLQALNELMKKPITDFISIDDTFTEMAIKIIQKQIDNKEYPIIIPQYTGGKK